MNIKKIEMSKKSEEKISLESTALEKLYEDLVNNSKYKEIASNLVQEYKRGKINFNTLEGCLIFLYGIKVKEEKEKKEISSEIIQKIIEQISTQKINIGIQQYAYQVNFAEYIGALVTQIDKNIEGTKKENLYEFYKDLGVKLVELIIPKIEKVKVNYILEQINKMQETGNLHAFLITASIFGYKIKEKDYSYNTQDFEIFYKKLLTLFDKREVYLKLRDKIKNFYGDEKELETYLKETLGTKKSWLIFFNRYEETLNDEIIRGIIFNTSAKIWQNPNLKIEEIVKEIEKAQNEVLNGYSLKIIESYILKKGKKEDVERINAIAEALVNLRYLEEAAIKVNSEEYTKRIAELMKNKKLTKENVGAEIFNKLSEIAFKNIEDKKTQELILLGIIRIEEIEKLKDEEKSKKIKCLEDAKRLLFSSTDLNIIDLIKSGKSGWESINVNKDFVIYKILSEKGFNEEEIKKIFFAILPTIVSMIERDIEIEEISKKSGLIEGLEKPTIEKRIEKYLTESKKIDESGKVFQPILERKNIEDEAKKIIESEMGKKVFQNYNAETKKQVLDEAIILYTAKSIVDAIIIGENDHIREYINNTKKKFEELRNERRAIIYKEEKEPVKELKDEKIIIEKIERKDNKILFKTKEKLNESILTPNFFGFYRGSDPDKIYSLAMNMFVNTEILDLKNRPYSIGDYEFKRVLKHFGYEPGKEKIRKRAERMYKYALENYDFIRENLLKGSDILKEIELAVEIVSNEKIKKIKEQNPKNIEEIKKRTFAQILSIFYVEHSLVNESGTDILKPQAPSIFISTLRKIERDGFTLNIELNDIEKLVNNTLNLQRGKSYELKFLDESGKTHVLASITITKDGKRLIKTANDVKNFKFEKTKFGSVIYITEKNNQEIIAFMQALYWKERILNIKTPLSYGLFNSNIRAEKRATVEYTMLNYVPFEKLPSEASYYWFKEERVLEEKVVKREVEKVETKLKHEIIREEPIIATDTIEKIKEIEERIPMQLMKRASILLAPSMFPNYYIQPIFETLLVTSIYNLAGRTSSGETDYNNYINLLRELGITVEGNTNEDAVKGLKTYLNNRFQDQPEIVKLINDLKEGQTLILYGREKLTQEKPQSGDYFKIETQKIGNNVMMKVFHNENSDYWIEFKGDLKTQQFEIVKESMPIGGIAIENLLNKNIGPLHLNLMGRAAFLYGVFEKEGFTPKKIKIGKTIPMLVLTGSISSNSLGIELPKNMEIAAFGRVGAVGLGLNPYWDAGIHFSYPIRDSINLVPFITLNLGLGVGINYKKDNYEFAAGVGLKSYKQVGSIKYPFFASFTYNNYGIRLSFPLFIEPIINGKGLVDGLVETKIRGIKKIGEKLDIVPVRIK